MIKSRLKKFSWYREMRYLVRAFTHYRKSFFYCKYRYVVGPRIRHRTVALDRAPEDISYSLHILCAHRDLTLLLWCMASWHQVVSSPPQLYIHEDSSFTEDDIQLIHRTLPHAKIIMHTWATMQAKSVWLKEIPQARALRLNPRYVFALKLIDPYFVSEAPARLLIDADMLWFRNPEEVLMRLHDGTHPFFVQGGPHEGFQFKDGSLLSPHLSAYNAGIIGYQRSHYQLSDLEDFCARVGPRTNPYLLEQSGHAWILSRHAEPRALNPAQYIIKGNVTDEVVAKHYTGPRREQFWFEGVRLLSSRFTFS